MNDIPPLNISLHMQWESVRYSMPHQFIYLASDQELQSRVRYTSKRHWCVKLLQRSICLLHEMRGQTHMKTASVGGCLTRIPCSLLGQQSITHRQHSFTRIQLGHWQKVYFLKRSLSSITPSEVVWRVSLNISMHSFNRGSDVRNPVDLSAY